MIDLDAYASLAAPAPTRNAVSEPFWAGAADGRLMLQHCADCGRHVFYPRAICPHCWSQQLSWQPAIGTGTLATWSVQHRPGHPGWEPVAPFTIGLVTLAEGPTLLSHILAEPEQLRAGLPLKVRFVLVGKDILPFFELAS